VEVLKRIHSKCRLPALASNIRLGWKQMTVTYALAFDRTELTAAVKKLLAPGDTAIVYKLQPCNYRVHVQKNVQKHPSLAIMSVILLSLDKLLTSFRATSMFCSLPFPGSFS
jgi:hypothetical protein